MHEQNELYASKIFFNAALPLLKVIATVIGGAIVGAVSLLWRIFTAAFNAIAGLINWVAGLLGGLGETIQWLAGGLSSLIDKAAQFIGMKGQIASTNDSFIQGMMNRGRSNNVNNTQNNNYTFTNPIQYPPVAKTNNQLFADTNWE